MVSSSKRKNVLPKEKPEKKLLVLDMDETLVHCTHTSGEDTKFSFTLVEGGIPYYVKLRPDVHKFLERVAEMFDVMVFTAADKDYADNILNFLDPEGKLISRRAYLDSGTYPSDGSGYVKDLTGLGVDLTKVAIIDNAPHNFRLQKNNGIPIKTWKFDPKDRELVLLLPFLETLVAAEDVRPLIAEKFYSKNHKKAGNKKH